MDVLSESCVSEEVFEEFKHISGLNMIVYIPFVICVSCTLEYICVV